LMLLGESSRGGGPNLRHDSQHYMQIIDENQVACSDRSRIH
jgi:hypothetical protein